MVSGLDLLQGNRSGVDLLNQKKVSSGLELLLEPQAPVDKTLFPDEMAVAHEQKPVIKPEDFYNKVAGSPYGIMTPELTNYMGRKGFGPKPAGGFDEFGRALDAEGKTYEESFEAKEKTRGVIAETLKGLSVMAMNPMETIKGGLDFVLSLPGFGVGLIGATARGSKELIDQVAIGQTFDLDKVYEASSKGMAEGMMFFEPGKEMVIGQPTAESQMVGQVVMAPMNAMSAIGQQIAGWEGFANYPNIRGAAKFTGDIAGLATMGMLLHGPSRRAEVAKSLEDVVTDAAKIVQKEKEVAGISDATVRQVQAKILEVQKSALEKKAAAVAKTIGEEALITEEIGRQKERVAMEKAYPVASTGLKKPTKAQVRKLFEEKKDELIVKHPDAYVDGEVDVKKAAEKMEDGKVISIEQVEGLRELGYDDEYIYTLSPKDADYIISEKRLPKEVDSSKRPAKEGKVKVEPSKPTEVPYKGSIVKEAHEVFDAAGMDPKYKRMKNFRVIEHTVQPGEPIDIPATWHDAAFRRTIARMPDGTLEIGESGSYDTILWQGSMADGTLRRGLGAAAARKGSIPPGATLYILDTGGEGSVAQTRSLRIYRAAPETGKIGGGKKIPQIEAPKVIRRRKGAEDKVVEPPEPVTEVDRATGTELPALESERSPFFQNKEETQTFDKLYAEREKAVREDVELFTQKTINDVNKWYHGDETVDIKATRNRLSIMASTADSARNHFETGADHLQWKDTVREAAEWARKLDRLKNKRSGGTQLNMMIPVDELPTAVIKFFAKGKEVAKNIFDTVRSDEMYRNEKLWKQTGFWLGKDGFWRFEIAPEKSKFNLREIKDTFSYKSKLPLTRRLTTILEYPELYKNIPYLKETRVVIEPQLKGYSGQFNARTNTIHIKSSTLVASGREGRKVLEHEIQHGINEAVGSRFKGSNVETQSNLLLDEMLHLIKKNVTDPEVLKEVNSTISLNDKLNKKLSPHSATEKMEKIAYQKNERDYKVIRKALDDYFKKEPHKEYLKDEGEMEARLAEARMEMSPKERKIIPPWETLEDMLFDEGLTREYQMEPSSPLGRKLYSGLPLDEAAKTLVAGARKVAEYTKRARGMKQFKPTVAAKMIREEFNRAFIDRSGNIRKEMLDELGAEGYEVVQKMYLAKGSSSIAANMLKQMQKEVYSGLSKNEKRILDNLILSDRMVDIGKYKTPKEFKFPEEIKPENSVAYSELFEHIEKLSPEKADVLRNRVAAYFEWMKQPLKDMLDAGLISEQEFNDLSSHNYRRLKLVDVYDKRYKAKVGKKARTVYDSGVEALAHGRETDIFEPSSEIMALEVFNRAYGRIMNNKANQGLLEVARNHPENPFVRVRESKNDRIPSGWNRVFMYEGGERKAIYLSPEMSKEWIVSSPETSYRFSQMLRYASGSPVLRTFATGINWGFALANVPRDIMHTWFAARTFKDGKWTPVYNPNLPVFMMQMARDQAAVFSDAALKKGRYQDYINEGGGMEFLVHQGRLFQRGRHLESGVDKFYNFMGYFGETSEIMTRLAIRERVLRKGGTAQEATFAARDYMDFGQGGGIAKAVDNAIPYLNASIQGTRGLFRAFQPGSGSALSSTYKLAQLGALVTGVYLYNNSANPKTMENLKGSVDMQNNLCLPLGDEFSFVDNQGQTRYIYFKIPIDPGQKFFKTFFEASADKWLGNEVDVDQVVESLKQFSPVGGPSDILPPTVSGTLGYIANKDFWTNEDIWKKTEKPFSYPQSKEEYIPGRTPQAFIDLGAATGLSPERTKYAVEELVTGGTIWSYLAGKGYEELFSDLPKDKKEQHLAMVLARMPVAKRFIGVTNPYSKFAEGIDVAQEKSVIDNFVQNRGLDTLAEGYLYKDNVSREEVFKYISSMPDKDTADRLRERFKVQEITKDLPERSFWLRLQSVRTDARAKVFVDRLESADEATKDQIWKEYGIVAKAGGIVTPKFREEVRRVYGER